MSNFLEAAKWTDRQAPKLHQIAAWEKAWSFLSEEEQKEFLHLFRTEEVIRETDTAVDKAMAERLQLWYEVVKEAREAGALYPDLVAAQFGLESGFGQFLSGKHNYFGLKGTGTEKETQEYVDGKAVTVKDEFKDFGSRKECIEYLVRLWYKDYRTKNGTVYRGVNRASSREEAAKLLQEYGYATDPSYSQKLIALMRQMAPVPHLVTQGQQDLGGSATEKQVKGHLTITFGDGTDSRGLRRLKLTYFRNGREVGSIPVVSGAPGRQSFRTGKVSRSGSQEPLPEGEWSVGDIEWVNGRDNYRGSWGPGLGPAFIALEYRGPGKTERSAIGIHIDHNSAIAPGTAGCVGVAGEQDFRTLVKWLRDTDPRSLFVNWGLGTCPPVPA